MRLKQGILGTMLFSLFSLGVFAQSSFYYRSSSGFSSMISETLDLIFGGIITPIINSISFNNFEAAVKVGLWIILFILFSQILKNYFKNMPAKFSKVIGGFFALFSVVFIPSNLLEFLFRDFLAGLVGYGLFFFIILLPAYYLYKWSKDSEERAVNLISAAGFFLVLLFLTYLDQEVVYNFNYGVMQNLASLTLTLGVLVCLVLFIYRLVKGLSGFGGGEEREERGEEGRRREEDGTEETKTAAHHLIGLCHQIGDYIQNLSDDPKILAHTLARNPEAINVFSMSNFHNVYRDVQIIGQGLDKYKGKNKKRAEAIGGELIRAYDYLRESARRFREIRMKLNSHLTNLRNSGQMNAGDSGFFGDLIGRIRRIDRDLQELAKVAYKIETL